MIARIVQILRQVAGAILPNVSRQITVSEWWALATVCAIAFVARVYRLETFPVNVTADEADNLKSAWRASATGVPGIFGFDWKPAPAFSIHVYRLFMAVFDDGIYGMRMGNAVLTTVAIVPFYLLARRVVTAPAAISGVILFAFGRWYLHFSRSGWENPITGLYALVAAWALLEALERGKMRWFVGAGMAATCGLYGYFSGRTIIIALLAYAPFAVWWARKPTAFVWGEDGALVTRVRDAIGAQVAARGLLTAVGLACALFLPMALTARQSWEYFNQRVAVVSVLNVDRPYFGEETTFGILRHQTEVMVRSWFLMTGHLFNDARYSIAGETIFDVTTSALVLVGLAVSLVRFRATLLWWLLLVGPLVATQIFSSGTPDAARGVQAAPFFLLFATLAIGALFGLAGRRLQPYLAPAIVAAAVVVACFNVDDYVRWQQTPGAQRAREPAVPIEELSAWKAATQCEFRGLVYELNDLDEWVCQP